MCECFASFSHLLYVHKIVNLRLEFICPINLYMISLIFKIKKLFWEYNTLICAFSSFFLSAYFLKYDSMKIYGNQGLH